MLFQYTAFMYYIDILYMFTNCLPLILACSKISYNDFVGFVVISTPDDCEWALSHAVHIYIFASMVSRTITSISQRTVWCTSLNAVMLLFFVMHSIVSQQTCYASYAHFQCPNFPTSQIVQFSNSDTTIQGGF